MLLICYQNSTAQTHTVTKRVHGQTKNKLNQIRLVLAELTCSISGTKCLEVAVVRLDFSGGEYKIEINIPLYMPQWGSKKKLFTG